MEKENILGISWNSFSKKRAAEYLKSFGHGSINSKKILIDNLKALKKPDLSVIELGCGNAQLYETFKEQGLKCKYVGVDISAQLLEAAQAANPEATFINDDVSELTKVTGRYDVAVFSHVIEMLSSPDQALMRAKQFADKVMIRFYVPPTFEFDTVEVREMEVADGKNVPCIRRKMSKDYYRLILTRMGCTSVDVYQDATSKDQVHVLHY